MGAWALYEKLYGTGVVPRWTTIMLLVALGSAAQLIMTGIPGEYIGRIYKEVNCVCRFQFRARVGSPRTRLQPPPRRHTRAVCDLLCCQFSHAPWRGVGYLVRAKARRLPCYPRPVPKENCQSRFERLTPGDLRGLRDVYRKPL